MINTLPDILSRIIEHKSAELQTASTPLHKLEEQAEAAIGNRRDFATALRARKPAIIAEIKKASPSKGLLADRFAPAQTAISYEQGGAAAISVLTDAQFFQGSLADLEAARAAVKIPALRKDFTTGRYHVIEAAAHNADAILLIAAVLSTTQLRDFRELAAHYKMASLVEVHDRDELSSALDSGAEIIGVNNRNLHTFQVTLETSLELAARIPAGILKVSESGIQSAADIATLQQAGYSAFLIGEHLMRSSDPAAELQKLTTCS